MLLKEAIEEISDLRRVIERVETRSGAGRRALLDAPYLRAGEEIRRELELVERASPLLQRPGVARLLSRVKDARGTIRRLAAGETPDDVELFEIKHLALLAGEISAATREAGVAVVEIPSLEAVVEILDPDGNRLPHFYIYDGYSPALVRLRARLEEVEGRPGEEALAERLRAGCLDEEERVRGWIGRQLHAYHRPLADALEAIARLDVLLAKARHARETGACKPVVSAGITRYEGLFHPLVREALRAAGREFQPVDVAFGREVTLVTGANMGGKTVLLKSLALAQALFQFGFHVPAVAAGIAPVDEIFLRVGDGQDATRGLSSFAAEMLAVDRVARAVKGGSDALVLLDEPARGTNPAEGVAIVDAIVDFLS
ncbi:MAG: DNA mismatch repair protein MutS, partial [Odoribacteraceae bacterium]|nr:DNA mismatch repair protein MutS [Odoribacteraceae bacterium]